MTDCTEVYALVRCIQQPVLQTMLRGEVDCPHVPFLPTWQMHHSFAKIAVRQYTIHNEFRPTMLSDRSDILHNPKR
ncbi:hypothetical protein NEUTE1DRAFT_118130 [Neurospora tetrasperma FGSC 2508]|uniref:Uncharacterized protein n=1 Tax=Neurospora tetrasperma (strain FGSC 2508 / ATCC MYA-4615 / P0657) TaxID=510951 RepID=F8MX23_NEUT8|nr:uncharacterized protein NEUTE1DRAFT_118130 [Neurospora tetrasperma FGSC 2508]EGO54294.1 hypothetical protein NEUTE1DRAFT_118130 [Neurospora tetrasperma FGSC 2508]EGZ68269.1 hypothetical protein NEUTE2DRAFT_145903 [Neurospora tetrasperma FGSC 2509]